MVVNGTGCIYRCSNEGDTEDILIGSEKLEWGDSVNPPIYPDNKARLRDAYASITRYKADNKAPQTNDSNSQDTGRADPTVNIVLYMENETSANTQSKCKNLISNWTALSDQVLPMSFEKGRFGLRVDSNTALNGEPRTITHTDGAAGYKILKAEIRVTEINGAHVATIHIELQWIGIRAELPL